MKILLAEDQNMLREALSKLLSLEDAVKEVSSVKNGEEAVNLLKKQIFDVVILDVEMPKMTGLDVLKWIKQNNRTEKVIIITTFRRSGYFEEAILNNVDAYVLKDRSIEELMMTINNVLAEKKEYSPELMVEIINNKNPLSDQEKQIMIAMEIGLTNKEIADKLHLSNGTVRNYISTIYNKLGVENRVSALKKIKDMGWI